jgi:predicted nucleic acid-binding protein
VTAFVIDASVALKWAFEEPGRVEATALFGATLAAPELIMAECANAAWKKIRRREISVEEAVRALRAIATVPVNLIAASPFVEAAVRAAVILDHPAYDCIYLALAERRGWPFVTADERFVRKARQISPQHYGRIALTLAEAAAQDHR